MWPLDLFVKIRRHDEALAHRFVIGSQTLSEIIVDHRAEISSTQRSNLLVLNRIEFGDSRRCSLKHRDGELADVLLMRIRVTSKFGALLIGELGVWCRQHPLGTALKERKLAHTVNERRGDLYRS